MNSGMVFTDSYYGLRNQVNEKKVEKNEKSSQIFIHNSQYHVMIYYGNVYI